MDPDRAQGDRTDAMTTARPWPLDLPPASQGADGRTVEEAFRRIQEWAAPFGGGAPSLELLARWLGGQHFEGQVNSSVDATTAGDTTFTHNLGRVPALIILSPPTDGGTGMVRGLPAGGDGTTGVNVGAWTKTQISVRATVSGTFQFVVI